MVHYFTRVASYHLTDDGVPKVEEIYGAKYVGPFCIRNSKGGWTDMPVDVFYQPKPDTEKGHTHYFGIFRRDGSTFICDASSAFSEPMHGLVAKDDEVIVSHWRHDFRKSADGSVAIDGGRDYTRAMNMAAPEGDDTVCRPGLEFVKVGVQEDRLVVLA